MILPKLQIAFAAIATSNWQRVAKAFQLKDAPDYEVNRSLLESIYPAYKQFQGDMHAGLMPAALPESDANARDDYSSYFFWLFQPDVALIDGERADETFRGDTLIVWFNGGPGCSSLVGLLGEMGPVGLAKFGPGIRSPNPATLMDAPMVYNDFAWTKKSAMLFVEQPGGTGFSTASSEWTGLEAEKRTEDDVAESFYQFLQNIYTVFGKKLAKKKIYLTGESYAGYYIPSIARGLHRRNKKVLAKDEEYTLPSLHLINLRGIAIGNGWIDPHIQGSTSIDFAWWHGMIDLPTYRGLHKKWEECIADQILENPFHPWNTPDECGISSAVMEASGSTFPYDVTTYDAYPALLNPGGTISAFFNDPVVRESLNAPSKDELPMWLACVPGSGRRRRHLTSQRELIMLEHDKPMSVVPYIAELLDGANIDVLMYNGDLDLACSSQSTELALESMDWTGKDGWLDPDVTKWKQWNVDDSPSGHTKKYKNLQFLVVYNSGHFVPINQARNSLNMIGRLIEGKPMGDVHLPMFPARKYKKPEIDSPSGKGSHHNHIILPGLIGFLLGILASHFIAKHFTFSKCSPSSHSTYDEVTEALPLQQSIRSNGHRQI